jgi:hypothetical protein
LIDVCCWGFVFLKVFFCDGAGIGDVYEINVSTISQPKKYLVY